MKTIVTEDGNPAEQTKVMELTQLKGLSTCELAFLKLLYISLHCARVISMGILLIISNKKEKN